MSCQRLSPAFLIVSLAASHHDGASYLVTRGEIALVARGGGAPRSRHRLVASISRCAARSARIGTGQVRSGVRTRSTSTRSSTRVWFEWIRDVASRGSVCVCVRAKELRPIRLLVSHEGIITVSNCWQPLLDYLSAATAIAAATSQPVGLGEENPGDPPVSSAPWNVLIVRSDRLQQGYSGSPGQWAGRITGGPLLAYRHPGMSSDLFEWGGPTLCASVATRSLSAPRTRPKFVAVTRAKHFIFIVFLSLRILFLFCFL